MWWLRCGTKFPMYVTIPMELARCCLSMRRVISVIDCMALRVDLVSILILLWLIVLTFWQKTCNFTLGECAGPGSIAKITVISYRFYFTLGGC